MDASYIKAFFFGLALMLAGTMQDATAQVCASIATQQNGPWSWFDSGLPTYNIYVNWNLTQDSKGNITGTYAQVSPLPAYKCSSSVTGTYSSGAFYFAIANGGCMAGAGTNPAVQGIADVSSDCSTMTVTQVSALEGGVRVIVPAGDDVEVGPYTHVPTACTVPTGETPSMFETFGVKEVDPNTNEIVTYSTAARFSQQATPTTANWSGITVSEQLTPVIDDCYFGSKSPFAPQKHSVPVLNFSIVGGYDDDIGVPDEVVNGYRKAGKAPCGFSATQTLVVNCPTGAPVPYTSSHQEAGIGVVDVTDYRNQISPVQTTVYKSIVWGVPQSQPPPPTVPWYSIVDYIYDALLSGFN